MSNAETLEAVYIYIVEFNKRINKHRDKAMYFRRI